MNSIFLDTLQGKKRERPPVWFMRQAGRCLPNYNKLRKDYSFMELMENPQLASKVTLMPVEELGVDAAILFSDILVIPQALGMDLSFTDKGPRFETALKDVKKPESILQLKPNRLSHVYEAIEEIIKNKPENIPLIGFCGGPLTVLCYMIQGLGTNHEFPDAVKLLEEREDTAHILLDMITEISITYALKQIEHGIEAFQLFETWAGLIPAHLYNKMVMPYVNKILTAVRKKNVPVIFFPRLMGNAISNITTEISDGISIDQHMSLNHIRTISDPNIVLQGNLDPECLFKSWDEIQTVLKEYGEFGRKDSKWIFNLGHGVMPDTSDKILKKVVDWVKEFDWQR
jgi:uroporphyrinogen decarboxylase